MKALVLSGGKGTRLRPITHTNAKQLVPIANKPILFYAIESIKEAGIKDIGVVVGDTKEEIKAALGNGSKWGVKITYIEQEAPLGLAHAVKISKGFINGDDFVMFLGDNLIKDGIVSLVDRFRKIRPASQILLARVAHPEQFGVAELKEGKVLKLVEKPENPRSDLALVGVYMFDKSIFEAVENIKPSNRGELEITDAIQYLIDHKFTVHPHIIDGWWKDTGKLEDILEANRIILDSLSEKIEGKIDENSKIYGKVVVEKGAEIINSVIRGPVIIGKDTKIVHSYVGPFSSVYYEVTIENSEIEHSIVLQKSKIKDIKRIEDSLIGQNVEILRSTTKPIAYRIMVGDGSRVEVI
ncbi:glucose-1-phosphate thymidylyltransferase [bacterium]|nr:glucose-1-phosphate thymidylyltransferase [bacterium]